MVWGIYNPKTILSLHAETFSRYKIAGLILGLHPVNERHRYKVTPFLIGWGQT